MIEHVENVARPRAHERVVERGAKIDEHERSREDGAARDNPDRAARADDNKIRCPEKRKRGAHTVGDGVSEDIAEAVGVVHELHGNVETRVRQ